MPPVSEAPEVMENSANVLGPQSNASPPTYDSDGKAWVQRMVGTRIPTEQGEFLNFLYVSSKNPAKEHIAMVYGNPAKFHNRNILTRIHSECFTGEVIGSLRCDCREQLRTAQDLIAKEGCGVIIYLRQEGRGIGLLEKLRAYNLQDCGYDTVDANLALGHKADERTYEEAALMLKDLGIESIRLLTNNQDKLSQMKDFGVKIVGRVQMAPKVLTKEIYQYIKTKVERMDHLLNVNELAVNTQTPLVYK